MRLHRIGVFLPPWLPMAAVGPYPTLFTLASSALKTFSVFVATIGGIVSVTLSRPHPITGGKAAVNRYHFCAAQLPTLHNGVRTFLPAVVSTWQSSLLHLVVNTSPEECVCEVETTAGRSPDTSRNKIIIARISFSVNQSLGNLSRSIRATLSSVIPAKAGIQ